MDACTTVIDDQRLFSIVECSNKVYAVLMGEIILEKFSLSIDPINQRPLPVCNLATWLS